MSALVPTDASGAFKLAEMMSTGKLVPSHLQRSPGDCLMVIEQAMRWGMSPFAVAQCTSVIQGKLMFEGKLVAAAIQSCGILSDRLHYEFNGEGDKRTITVSGTIKGEAKPRTVDLALKDAKTTNGMWVKQPDQQLVYAGTRVWGRRHCPEVMLGVYSPEEMEPVRDTFTGTTITATVDPPEPVSTAPAPTKRTVREIVRDHLVGCESTDDVANVADMPMVAKALKEAPEAIREELNAMLGEAYAKFAEMNLGAAHEPEPVA